MRFVSGTYALFAQRLFGPRSRRARAAAVFATASLLALAHVARAQQAASDALVALFEGCRDSNRCTVARVQQLVRAGADPNAENGRVLFLAVVFSSPPEVLRALTDAGARLDYAGQYALMPAAAAGCQSSDAARPKLAFLLDHGASIDAAAVGGRTALMTLAAEGSCPGLVQYLIDRGANQELRDFAGKTALQLARERLEQVKALNATPGQTEMLKEGGQQVQDTVRAIVDILFAALRHPASPYIVEHVCPYEGCNFGRQIADSVIHVYRADGSTAVLAFKIARNEVYTTVDGNVHAVPGAVVLKRSARLADLAAPYRRDASGKPIIPRYSLQQGDTAYPLAYLGEGVYRVWYQGKEIQVEQFWASSTYRPVNPAGGLLIPPSGTWWVKIRNTNGAMGWAPMMSFGPVMESEDTTGGDSMPGRTAAAAPKLEWKTLDLAREFAVAQEQAITGKMPVPEDDWRDQVIMFVTLTSGKYSQAMKKALNDRSLALESLATADKAIDQGYLQEANNALHMSEYYYASAVAHYQEAGYTLDLAGTAAQKIGEASAQVACLSGKLAVAASPAKTLQPVASLLCIDLKFAVANAVGDDFDQAAGEAAAGAITEALVETLPVDTWLDPVTGVIGHDSGLYQLVEGKLSQPGVAEQVLRLAGNSSKLAGSGVSEAVLKRVLQAYMDLIKDRARQGAGSGI
jgi:Ankyrin repeat